jgi:HSP20 family molecular chaperone IbpA
MRRISQLLIAGLLLTAALSLQGYALADDPGGQDYQPYAGYATGRNAAPSLHIRTGMTADGYHVRAYLGGLRPEDVEVVVRGNRLVLQTVQSNVYRSTGPDARSIAQWHMRLRRQLRLPYDADWTRMTMTTENGIMDIYIPRRNQYLPDAPYSDR